MSAAAETQGVSKPLVCDSEAILPCYESDMTKRGYDGANTEERLACFVTAVARNRLPVLACRRVAEVILQEVEFYRAKHGYHFCGFVIMPDHWHFLMIARVDQISPILRDLKSMIARLVLDDWRRMREPPSFLDRLRLTEPTSDRQSHALWQPGNWTVLMDETVSMEHRLRYMHENPVRAGLVRVDHDWPWSSAGWYFDRSSVGIRLDADWMD